MTDKMTLGRRGFVGVLAAGMALAMSGVGIAQDLVKVAAIWTVPVEQQWASRLHNALVAAKERGEDPGAAASAPSDGEGA